MVRLSDAPFLTQPGVQRLLAVLNPPGGVGETRVVGGAIRNALMGLPITDLDCATVLLPGEVIARAEQAGFPVVPTGIEHGTVTVLVEGRPHEVTTLRRDMVPDGRRSLVAFGTDWAEDARRRDLTINALYCDADGTVHDPLDGLGDVMARRVRFIGDPDARIREDYLRLLRFFRFHAQVGEGAIDDAGFRAAVRNRAGVGRLSAERVRQEILKLLAAPRAETAVAALAETGVLSDLLGVPMMARFARLAIVEAHLGAAPDALARLAALAVRLPEDVERLAIRLRLARAEQRTLDIVARLAPLLAQDPSRVTGRHVLCDAGDAFPVVARVAWAIARADLASPQFRMVWDLPVTAPVPPFPLRGADLASLGVSSGPAMGALLDRARAVWREGDYAATRDALLDVVRRNLPLV